MNFTDKVFVNPKSTVDPSAQVIFVADLFIDEYVGGAELTSEAIIQESPYKIQKIKSKNVNLSTLKQGVDKFWIFGNFSQLNPELIPSIVANLKYSVLEYDYKYCRFRSPEKHEHSTGSPCDCHNQMNGKLISAFYHGSRALWWMSEAQKNRYFKVFPFLSEKDNIVLSSVFSKETLGALKELRGKVSQEDRSGWIVLGSQSWVKGYESAKKWCEDSGKIHEVVWNLPYELVLSRLAAAEGFVYLPVGGDTCPRMVIEAKLLGCKLHINENVQHANEEWFATDDIDSIHEYLFASPALFWRGITKIMEMRPKISGYTTTYNCISQGYPFENCIRSMLQFCEEVCVVDGGSSDGTLERLRTLSESSDGKLKVKVVERDWGHPRFAVFDGMQKAEARKMCTGDLCWQMDSDEIVHEDDVQKIQDLSTKIPGNVDVISLPVVEYWGNQGKVRCDIQPWKWRLSRNKPHITHGIPRELRRVDASGHLYAAEGTDGCDMIHSETFERLPHVTFHTTESEKVRQVAASGNQEALKTYQAWFNSVIHNLPGVHHYSWHDLPRKIKTYKNYWTKHWESLTGKSYVDSSESNMMFDVPWRDVTDEMIEARAQELLSIGGWIWHRKWNGTITPWMTIDRSEPRLVLESRPVKDRK